MPFPEHYAALRNQRNCVREGGGAPVTEELVQCIWYDQLLRSEELRTVEGRPLRVISPGWWNRTEGPDFKGAQIDFDGRIATGDVEVHLTHRAWREHGHDRDPRYDDVILHVVLQDGSSKGAPVTAAGRAVPTLLLGAFLDTDIKRLAETLPLDASAYDAPAPNGHCATIRRAHDEGRMDALLELAGDWRLVSKARTLRERMEQAGAEQAVYEALLSACGYSRFKHHFHLIAKQLPYDRVRQLARQDALLVETAYLQIAGLLPDALPGGTTAMPHFARLRALRRDHISGLRGLPLQWRRTGVRPTNYPERRLAGIARFIARTAEAGLLDALDSVWLDTLTALKRRRAFEALFPRPMGFWATHCTWGGKKLARPTAPIGPARVRSIIGNVFVPFALAMSRQRRDRAREEEIYAFYRALPKESDNHVLKAMVPRVFTPETRPRMTFRTQQGLLQMFYDWCEPNPSCRNCPVIPYLSE
jgi:uncharacterized protein DUF2851